MDLREYGQVFKADLGFCALGLTLPQDAANQEKVEEYELQSPPETCRDRDPACKAKRKTLANKFHSSTTGGSGELWNSSQVQLEAIPEFGAPNLFHKEEAYAVLRPRGSS